MKASVLSQLNPPVRWFPTMVKADHLVLLLWLLVVAAMLYVYWPQIGILEQSDPDDALRLVQVRDLLGGQPWHDLTQYRINPAGGGGELHWSRFIDVQIAAIISFFGLFLSPGEAERWGLALYPLTLILVLLALMRRVLDKLGDPIFVAAGLVMTATSFSFLHYFVPLRIDHHNWQLLLSLAMLWLALGRATVMRGLAAALVISIHLEISLEGLPYLVFFGAIFAFDWWIDPRTSTRLRGFAAGLIIIPAAWTTAMRGVDAVTGNYCDAFSRPYLLGASVASAVILVLANSAWAHQKRTNRLIILALAGIAGAAAFVATGPACLSGPFGNLSPLVREYWYEGISEGRPVWEQSAKTMVSFAVPSLIGFLGVLWSAQRQADTPYATEWRRLTMAAAGSVLLSLLVLRTTAVTHVYVLPGFIIPAIAIFRWARSLSSPIMRVPATASIVAASPIGTIAIVYAILTLFITDKPGGHIADCITPKAAARFAELPKGTLFAGLDMASEILSRTPHNVVATGHHRNHKIMHQVISAFISPPAEAEAIVRQSGATHVVACINIAEFRNFAQLHPDGLAARIKRGQLPTWLEMEPGFSGSDLKVLRVLPAASVTPE